MPLAPFESSQSLTLGVELELQLLNLSDFSLAAASDDLLTLLKRKPFPGTVTHEITQGMIEVATSVHSRHDALLAELQGMRDTLVRGADRLNVGISGGGIHPFQTWPEHRITERPRYLQVSSLYGYLAKQFTVFGQHAIEHGQVQRPLGHLPRTALLVHHPQYGRWRRCHRQCGDQQG